MDRSIILEPAVLKKVLRTPEKALEHIHLIYTTENQLSIARKKIEDQFIYLKKGKPIVTKKDLERIKKLVIPPAWQNVKIAHLDNSHLQAIGRDKKHRKQYRYHPLWTKVRNQTKFYNMLDFGQKLPLIRKRIDQDLDQNTWNKTKVLALVIRLMEETHIRIGNEQYAKRNKTYGLSTLRTRHVKTYKEKKKFEFTGKKGKKHSITLKNKKLIKLVNKCEEIPGWELFQYYDSDGEKHAIDSQMINEYIHSLAGEYHTAKDFRTWSGSIIFFESLLEQGITSDAKEIKQNLIVAYDTVAKNLGNTRAVCKKYYVHPYLAASYEDHSIAKHFKIANQETSSAHFTSSEKAVMNLLKNYKPQILIE